MRCTNAACATEFFPRIDPAIIIALVTDGERARCSAGGQFAPGRYSTIAGFVEPGESLEGRGRARGARGDRRHGARVALPLVAALQPFPGSLMLGFSASAITRRAARAASELEDAALVRTREQVALARRCCCRALLISFRLIEALVSNSAGGFPPMREIPAVGSWEARAAMQSLESHLGSRARHRPPRRWPARVPAAGRAVDRGRVARASLAAVRSRSSWLATLRRGRRCSRRRRLGRDRGVPHPRRRPCARHAPA